MPEYWPQIAQKTSRSWWRVTVRRLKPGMRWYPPKIIPGVLALILIYLGQDPTIRSSLAAFPVQIAIAIGMGDGDGLFPDALDDHGGGMTIIPILGILAAALIIVLTVEFVPVDFLKPGSLCAWITWIPRQSRGFRPAAYFAAA